MVNIVFPSSAHTREVVNKIRQVIGRPVTFYTEVINTCTASECSLNPVTGDSTNPFCLVCNGEFYYNTFSGVVISGHISHGKEDILQFYPVGQHFDGDCRIQIEYTDENLTIIDATSYVEADGKTYEIKKSIPRGFPDLNRILLDCKERDK